MNNKFNDLINSTKPTLVDFFAEWCGPCKTMAPILENLKNKIGASATIIKIDIDKNPNAANVFQVKSVPTLILFKEGKVVWKQSGVVPANQLQQVIMQYV